MNNSSFLSNNVILNTEYKIEKKQNFLSDNKNHIIKNEKFQIINYESKNKNCIIKSATTKRWSIKFR